MPYFFGKRIVPKRKRLIFSGNVLSRNGNALFVLSVPLASSFITGLNPVAEDLNVRHTFKASFAGLIFQPNVVFQAPRGNQFTLLWEDRMHATLDRLNFEVVKFQRHLRYNGESKLYLSKKIAAEVLNQHQTSRVVADAA
jgi:hypothetical protein